MFQTSGECERIFLKSLKAIKKGLAIYEKVARPFLYMLCMEILGLFLYCSFLISFLSV